MNNVWNWKFRISKYDWCQLSKWYKLATNFNMSEQILPKTWKNRCDFQNSICKIEIENLSWGFSKNVAGKLLRIKNKDERFLVDYHGICF